MLLKIKNLAFFLIINLFGLSLAAMEINPEKKAELTQETEEFQALLASIHKNPKTACMKVLEDVSLGETDKQTIFNKLKYYGANIAFETVLKKEILSNNYESVESLINLSANIGINLNKDILLMHAMAGFPHKDSNRDIAINTKKEKEKNCIKIIKLLLDSGANPNTHQDGFTILMLASFYHSQEIIEVLVESGADISLSLGECNAINLPGKFLEDVNIVKHLKEALQKQKNEQNAFVSLINAMAKAKHNQKLQQLSLQK